LPQTPLTFRDRDAPDVPLAEIFGSTKRDWPTVHARPYISPGSTDPKIDEMSYFVSLAHDTFRAYLIILECDLQTWLGTACEKSGGLSATIIGAIVGGAIGFCLIVFLLFCLCCYRKGEYGKKLIAPCCGGSGEQGTTSKGQGDTSKVQGDTSKGQGDVSLATMNGFL